MSHGTPVVPAERITGALATWQAAAWSRFDKVDDPLLGGNVSDADQHKNISGKTLNGILQALEDVLQVFKGTTRADGLALNNAARFDLFDGQATPRRRGSLSYATDRVNLLARSSGDVDGPTLSLDAVSSGAFLRWSGAHARFGATETNENDFALGVTTVAARRIAVVSSTAEDSVAHHLAVTDGTRNARAKFFLRDSATAGNRAFGLWATASSGSPDFVLGNGASEWMRIAAATGLMTLPGSQLTMSAPGAISLIGDGTGQPNSIWRKGSTGEINLQMQTGAGVLRTSIKHVATSQDLALVQYDSGGLETSRVTLFNSTGALRIGGLAAGGAELLLGNAANTSQATIRGEAVGATDAGRSVNIRGGGGGATSGAGGLLLLQGGIPTAGAGGGVTLEGYDGVGTNQPGGGVAINGGDATGSGAAGNVALLAGSSPSGTDGIVSLTTVGGIAFLGADGLWVATMGSFRAPEAASIGAPGAGFGTFWVRNDAPSTPMFTGDTSISRRLAMLDVTTEDFSVDNDLRLLGQHGHGNNSSAGTLATTVNDWNPTNFADRTVIDATAAVGGSTINGIEASGNKDQHRIIRIVNRSTTDTTTLAHENTGSTTTNRITCPNATNIVIRNRGCATLIYMGNLGASSRWYVLSVS